MHMERNSIHNQRRARPGGGQENEESLVLQIARLVTPREDQRSAMKPITQLAEASAGSQAKRRESRLQTLGLRALPGRLLLSAKVSTVPYVPNSWILQALAEN